MPKSWATCYMSITYAYSAKGDLQIGLNLSVRVAQRVQEVLKRELPVCLPGVAFKISDSGGVPHMWLRLLIELDWNEAK